MLFGGGGIFGGGGRSIVGGRDLSTGDEGAGIGNPGAGVDGLTMSAVPNGIEFGAALLMDNVDSIDCRLSSLDLDVPMLDVVDSLVCRPPKVIAESLTFVVGVRTGMGMILVAGLVP